MSVIGEIRVSLDTMGFEQQACLFAFLSSYPLALGALLPARGRRWAAAIAAAAMLGFAATTRPWMNGVLLMIFLVVAMGLFIATVWALDRLPRLALRRRARPRLAKPARLLSELPLVMPDAARQRDGARSPRLPLHGRAGTT